MPHALRPDFQHARQVCQILKQLTDGHSPASAGNPERRVAESWQRSFAQHGLRPDRKLEPRYLEGPELRRRRQRLEALHRLGFEEIARLQEQLRAGGFSVLLADRDGCILHRAGDQVPDPGFRRAGLAPGADWSESAVGTNGIGTAITRRQATLIHADEHFLADNIRLSCAAAPIRAGDGELLAVLDASALNPGISPKQRERTMGLVHMAARSIENAHLLRSCREHWIIAFHARPEFVGLLQQGLLAVDGDGRIRAANASALSQLGLEFAAGVIGNSFEDLTGVSLENLVSLSGKDDGLREASFGNDPVRLRLHAPAARSTSVPSPASDALDRVLAGPEPVLQEQLGRLRRLLDRDIPLFIGGETGTGKEVLAQAVHTCSTRARQPFVALNCAAIPAELIESELFGYRPGAFTGALREGMNGKLLQADGGTLFLDEIGDMPTSLQTRLLRVLETGEVVPLGASTPRKVAFHLLSASHQDLEQAVAQGRFREDLYYRINGFSIHLPALRDRHDLAGLIGRILMEESGRDTPACLDGQAMDALIRYHWPGNVRQLRHVLRVAVALCSDDVIGLSDLPEAVRRDHVEQACSPPLDNAPERAEILAALQRQRWNVRQAAQDLGVSRNTLYRRMHRHRIPLQQRR
ncbi:sigma-54-dependent Fis family transcriptional regulator [Methylonatrum kenyense]|uniref:sigma-54-dependent Fis family transcriptional regulator n=1 Tax=Methylonatrum kenyense TaxID=455253 RepID=UPI0020C1374F|nr:sigma-54-dependent Fis family transcriptional regulator [Methylonatrum kenyense]MCK8517294.1 sigma-54-dependent Fis family transcriptional regulator [Methylonatrum kenyense]